MSHDPRCPHSHGGNNKVDPFVPAPCLVKFVKPGGRRRPDDPDVPLPPVPPGGTGPPPGITSIGGPTMGIPTKYCKCFPEQGMHWWDPFFCIGPPESPGRELHWEWQQTCLETDSNGKVGGSNDPRGGWADIGRVFRMFEPGNTPCNQGEYLASWSQSDPNRHGHECHNKKTGNCDDPCDTIWLQAICCEMPLGDPESASSPDPVGVPVDPYGLSDTGRPRSDTGRPRGVPVDPYGPPESPGGGGPNRPGGY